jgi:hypothetical protein
MEDNKNTYSLKEIEKTAIDIINTEYKVDDDIIVSQWERYNSTFKDRFEYLTSIGEFDLPMNEVNVPLQRRLLDLLIAKKSRRPFNYSVYLDSQHTKDKKYKNRIRAFISFALNKVEEESLKYGQALRSIQQNLSRIKSVIAQNGQNGQDVPPEVLQQYQQLVDEFEFINNQIERKKALNDEAIEEFEILMKMSPDAVFEKTLTKFLKYLEREINFNYMSTMQFKNRVVTGHQNYMVAKFENNKPIIRPLNSQSVVYQVGGPETNINKKDWAYYYEKMSFAQIFENFGEDIINKYGRQALVKLRDMFSPQTNDSEMWALPDGGAIFGDDIFSNRKYNLSTENSIDIKWVWFRGGVPVSRRINTDKNGNIHKHILPSNVIINKDEFVYRKGYYINKKNPSVKYKKKEVSTYSKKSGDKIETKKYKKLYHAIVINDEYVIREGEWKNVIRDVDNYNRFNLPIFGKSFDSAEDQPYSLIKATNDIQDLIDMVWLSRSYMMAVAGTKGNVIDVSQKPDDMTTKEWEYHIKMGRIYIQTVDENGVPKRSSFNQWQNFDNSVSQAITYYDSLIENLIQMMGNIIGIHYQALGETTRADQVGTNKMAIQESQMVTEMLFYEHYMIDKEVLEEYVSLSVKDAEARDIIFTEPNISGTIEYSLSTEKLSEENIKINLYSATEDLQKIQELKQMVMSMAGNLNLSLGNIMKIWNADTLKEMEAKVEYFEERAKRVASEQAQAQKAEAMQTFKETRQFETEMDVYLESVKQKYKEAEVYVKQAALQFDQQKFAVESQIKMMDVQLKKEKNQIDLHKINQDNNTETAMLLYDDKHQSFDDNLRALELQVNTFFRSVELGLESRSLGLENKKIDVEDRKVKADARQRPTNTSRSKMNDN